MSDTPRTDAEIASNPVSVLEIEMARTEQREIAVSAEFARRLERQNGQLRDHLSRVLQYQPEKWSG